MSDNPYEHCPRCGATFNQRMAGTSHEPITEGDGVLCWECHGLFICVSNGLREMTDDEKSKAVPQFEALLARIEAGLGDPDA